MLSPEQFRFTPPDLPSTQVAAHVAERYGVAGDWQPLAGERDQNFRLQTDDGQSYVVKISSLEEPPQAIDFQIRALQHVAVLDPGLLVPRVIPSQQGQTVSWIDLGGGRFALRLLSYLEGRPAALAGTPEVDLAGACGAFVGRLARALEDFSHEYQSHFLPWDMMNGLIEDPVFWAEGAADIRALEAHLRPLFADEILPGLRGSRCQVIHNDAHLDNMLILEGAVSGLIDFGDMIFAPLVCDVAVAAEGCARLSNDPMAAAAAVTAGYHREYPLSAREILLIPDAMLVRAALSVLMADFKIRHQCAPEAETVRERGIAMEMLIELMETGRSGFLSALPSVMRMDG